MFAREKGSSLPPADAAIWCRPDAEGSVLLHLAGSIDIAARETLLAAGMTACLVAPVLLIDAGDVVFIDAAGLGALVEVVEFARQEGVQVCWDRRSETVERVLELTGLEQLGT